MPDHEELLGTLDQGKRIKSENFRTYWDKNIDLWAENYLDISHGHETFDRPAWFTPVYNTTIGRIERRLMKERYLRTIAFIDQYVKPGQTFTDLGCGTGIFVVEAAKRGAVVNAVDFSQSSLNATRKNIETNFPNAKVNFIQADVQRDQIPVSDVTLAMGVTPYLTNIDAFISNSVPNTSIICIQYSDPKHWANRVRTAIPFLDVRSLQYHDRDVVLPIYDKNGGVLVGRSNFASGYIDIVANEARVLAREDSF